MRPITIVAVIGVMLFGLLIDAQGQAAKPPIKVGAITQPAIRKSAETITAAALKNYVSFVASDVMEGRDTPSRGLDQAAQFLSTMLSRSGVKPAGDGGSYFQTIALKREMVDAAATRVEMGGQTFLYGKDFFAQGPAGAATGPMVYAGHGWLVKAKNIDAYAGVDPKGKIVIVNSLAAFPPGVTAQDLIDGKGREEWAHPITYAQMKGAVGVVVLVPLLTQADPDALMTFRKQAESGTFHPERLPRTRGELPVVFANLTLARAIFAKEKIDANTVLSPLSGATGGRPPAAFELSSDRTINFTVKTVVEKRTARNVVAVVEGSDTTLRREYVALGAHYDGRGVLPVARGDSILNGADDNGSGTAALLAMAEAFSMAPRCPRRSVLFIWYAGEERDLWGSRYYVSSPTVPIENIVAYLNLDTMGRTKSAGDQDPRNKDVAGPNEVYVAGARLLSSEFDALSEAVNDAYLKLSLNHKYEDVADPLRLFYRADHFPFALKGIPFVCYFTGLYAEYHQPGDEVSKIDFQKLERITRTIYATAWELGEMKTRLKIDRQLPPKASVIPYWWL